MKRKSRNSAEKQHESCGVWLDTSALKRCKLQNKIGKPTLRILNRLPSYPSSSKAQLPCTKQTTISTFFGAQQSGERKINTSEQLLAVAPNCDSNLKGHGLPAGGQTPLPASLIQPLVTQEYKQQAVEKPQHISPSNSVLTEAQSNSCVLSYTAGKHSASRGEDPLSLNFSQHQEKKRLLGQEGISKSTSREKNSWKKEKTSSQSSPNLKIVSDKRTTGWRRCKPSSSCTESSFMECSDSENIDPELEKSARKESPLKKFTKTLPGFRLKTTDNICSSNNVCKCSKTDGTDLFTQESKDHKVISHSFFHEQAKLPFQKKPQQGRSSPSHNDCFGACYSVERRLHIPPGGSLSVLADISQRSCYDMLFTEDSEGNKVIKH